MTKARLIAAAFVLATPLAAQRAPVKLPPRPEIPPGKPFTYPAVTYDSLPNGLSYAIVENHELPLVVVQTAFAGMGPLGISFLDAPGKQGAWGLMLTSLREGTPTRSSAQITDEAADMGTEMRFTSTIAYLAPSFRSARSTWKPSLDLLADVIVHPTFPEAGVARAQARLAGILDGLPPASLASRVLYANLYGADSPNNQFSTGASMRALTRDDVVAMQQTYLRPQNTTVVIAGDVTVPEARSALMKSFGGWQRGGTTITPLVPKAPAPAPTTIYLKDNPGAVQSLVSAGLVLPGRENADAEAIAALGSLLGDFSVSSGSRVYSAFRLERGLSYSPRVELASRPVPETAPLVATFLVPLGVTDTAITTLLRVYRELRQDKPASASELEFSKRNLIGKLPGEMERVDVMAANVLLTMRDRLPRDYMRKWISRIDSLTLPEVQAAAAKYLDPDHLTIVVIGDRAKIESALRATGIPVVIVDK
jgi:zinc protease